MIDKYRKGKLSISSKVWKKYTFYLCILYDELKFMKFYFLADRVVYYFIYHKKNKNIFQIQKSNLLFLFWLKSEIFGKEWQQKNNKSFLFETEFWLWIVEC